MEINKVITKFYQYIKESAYIDYFNILYNKAPVTLKNIIDSTKGVEQNPIWHSEGDCYTHIRLVTNRLGNAYPQDKNLLLAGLFHDLGKVKTTEWDEKKQSWTARGHEDISVEIVEEYKDWIENEGGNLNVVKNIVQNHMRIKYLDEFRLQNKIDLVNNPNFEDILRFNSADFGGTELEIKPLQDMSYLYKEIEEYQEKKEINKIINSKFNGNIIMQRYPNLKDKELGNAIINFKIHIKNKYNVEFEEFILNKDKITIMNEFDLFIK